MTVVQLINEGTLKVIVLYNMFVLISTKVPLILIMLVACTATHIGCSCIF